MPKRLKQYRRLISFPIPVNQRVRAPAKTMERTVRPVYSRSQLNKYKRLYSLRSDSANRGWAIVFKNDKKSSVGPFKHSKWSNSNRNTDYYIIFSNHLPVHKIRSTTPLLRYFILFRYLRLSFIKVFFTAARPSVFEFFVFPTFHRRRSRTPSRSGTGTQSYDG